MAFSLPSRLVPSRDQAGLVGYWQLDYAGVQDDETGNGNYGIAIANNGAVIPGPTTDTIVRNKNSSIGAFKFVGQAISAAAQTDYIEIAGNPAKLQITGAHTLAAWIKVDAYITSPGSSNRGIIAKYRSDSNAGLLNQRGYELYITDTSGLLGGTISADGTSSTLTSVAGGTAIPARVWSHAVARFVPSTSYSVFLNGVQDGINTTSIPASVFNSSAPLWIGNQFITNNGSINFNGWITQVRVFNRALSHGEIYDLYASELAGIMQLDLPIAVTAPSVLFRKTASRIGTRTGTRQTWAA